MKYTIVILIAAWLSGCSSLTALQASSNADTPASRASNLCKAGTMLPVNGMHYPAVAVTPQGGHAIVMPPCGNTSVVVNPDGSHSIAIINGTTATIITP